ncbi:MAG: formate transporter FocA [Chloroflexi bacterium RBG_13_68_17]|jgi:formate/nitrite transporter|nr:MAG: formate transporter FocA [Chloroflexi bacterium RBG_13_68_17]
MSGEIPEIHIDALLPAEMALKAEQIGVRKAQMPALTMFVLAILAGAFIAMGALFATTVAAGTSGVLAYGVARLLVGLVFCVGLILVVVGGAELFTGNNLIVMAWAGRKVTTAALLRNWVIVYLGNMVGSLGTAVLVFLGRQYTFGGGAVGAAALTIANSKVHLGFVQAIALGILCNTLVCLAVWMSFSARSTIDRIAAIIFPISAFVAAGFEHSVANMYFIPIGLLIKTFDPTFAAGAQIDLSGLTWVSFLYNNLLPVTIGNIIGGGVLVAAVYWFVFLRHQKS